MENMLMLTTWSLHKLHTSLNKLNLNFFLVILFHYQPIQVLDSWRLLLNLLQFSGCIWFKTVPIEDYKVWSFTFVSVK